MVQEHIRVLTMGKTQQRARWPISAQMALKLSASEGVEGAKSQLKVSKEQRYLTISAVEVGKSEDIGSATLGRAVQASAWHIGLTLLRSWKGTDNAGQSENDGELHVGGVSVRSDGLLLESGGLLSRTLDIYNLSISPRRPATSMSSGVGLNLNVIIS